MSDINITVKFPTEIVSAYVGNGVSFYNTKLRNIYWDFVSNMISDGYVDTFKDIDENITSDISSDLLYIAGVPMCKIHEALNKIAKKVKDIRDIVRSRTESMLELTSSDIDDSCFFKSFLNAVSTEEVHYLVNENKSGRLPIFIVVTWDVNSMGTVSSLVNQFGDDSDTVAKEICKYIARHYPFLKVFIEDDHTATCPCSSSK